jgi:hypothetical protein
MSSILRSLIDGRGSVVPEKRSGRTTARRQSLRAALRSALSHQWSEFADRQLATTAGRRASQGRERKDAVHVVAADIAVLCPEFVPYRIPYPCPKNNHNTGRLYSFPV